MLGEQYGHVRRRFADGLPVAVGDVGSGYGHLRARRAAAGDVASGGIGDAGAQYGHIRARRVAALAQDVVAGPTGDQYGHIRARRAAAVGSPYGTAGRGEQYGHLRARRYASGAVGAGRSTLGDFEREWARLGSLRGEEKRRRRRKLEREEARRVYRLADVEPKDVPALQSALVAVQSVELKAQTAILEATSEAQQMAARMALDMARKRAETLRQIIEEADLAYVAMILLGH